MSQLSSSETNRLRWLLKLERQEAMAGMREGWVPAKADREMIRRLVEKGLIESAVITEKGLGYSLTRHGAAKVGN